MEKNEPQPSAYRWVILTIAIVAYGTSQFSRQNYTGVQKFIAGDMHIDRGTLGLMGSAFFYAYALAQMPWGIASDRFGSRGIIGLGILLTAITTSGFATGNSVNALILWRILAGIAAAAVYVPLTGGIARWFPQKERGLSQGTLGGVGGAVGEGTAYAALPILSIYFASGWRQGMHMIAAVIAVMGLLTLALFRSAPAKQAAKSPQPFDWKLLLDPEVLCYSFIWSGFVVGIRIAQIWIAVYAADIYISTQNLPLNQAVVRGGVLALLCFSLIGRAVGCPLAGRMTDSFLKRGISRAMVLIGWMLLAIVLFHILGNGDVTIGLLAVCAALLGTAVNLFGVVPAAFNDRFGAQRTASLSSFANTMAQLAGATALALSGYVGISMNATPGNALAEYRGIWLCAEVGMGIMAALAIITFLAAKRPVQKELLMRTTSVLFVVLFVSMSGIASAQEEWTDYVNIPDGFHVNFPGQPKITNITWNSWHEFKYPGHVYSVDQGNSHYSITVVDYATAEQQGIEKAKSCPKGAEPCLGGDLSGTGYWKHDIRGAIQNAMFRIITRPNIQVKDYSWTMEDLVEGDQFELLNTMTGARTFGFVTMHKNKLYILEATVPKGYPPPALFTISLGWVDPQGKPVRYRTMYNNEFMELEKVPTPPLAGRGGNANQ